MSNLYIVYLAERVVMVTIQPNSLSHLAKIGQSLGAS